MNQAINTFSDDFIRGQRDCMTGKAHKLNESEAYDQGYGAEYQKEQVATELSIKNEPPGNY